MDASEIGIDVIGWLGTGLLLGAYALLTTGGLPAGRTFQVLNLVGGFFLLINSAYYGAWPSAGLSVVWVVIGTGGRLWLRPGVTGSSNVAGSHSSTKARQG